MVVNQPNKESETMPQITAQAVIIHTETNADKTSITATSDYETDAATPPTAVNITVNNDVSTNIKVGDKVTVTLDITES
jgi:cell envelope opacity-associated protein A